MAACLGLSGGSIVARSYGVRSAAADTRSQEDHFASRTRFHNNDDIQPFPVIKPFGLSLFHLDSGFLGREEIATLELLKRQLDLGADLLFLIMYPFILRIEHFQCAAMTSSGL